MGLGCFSHAAAADAQAQEFAGLLQRSATAPQHAAAVARACATPLPRCLAPLPCTACSKKAAKKGGRRRRALPDAITKKLGEANVLYALQQHQEAIALLMEVCRVWGRGVCGGVVLYSSMNRICIDAA